MAAEAFEEKMKRPEDYNQAGQSEIPEPDEIAHSEWARCYCEDYGFALCAIPPGTKGPTTKGWPEISLTPAHWDQHPNEGIGVILGRSGLASLDLDALPESRTLFAELGLDLDHLTAGACLVQGNPARLRAEFRAPDGVGLKTHKLVWPPRDPSKPKDHPDGKPVTVFELRAGPGQDVLPPTIHPDTHRPYEWLRAPWDLGADIAGVPPELLELWTDWDAWKQALLAMCPWAKPPEPKPQARGSSSGLSVISEWNRAHDVRELLESHGYTPKGKSRWLAPESSSGIPGVVLLPESGRIFSHHPGDPLATGHSLDAFGIYAALEHGGDNRAAVKAAAEALGMASKGRTHPESGPSAPPPPEAGDPGAQYGETAGREWPDPQPLTARVEPEAYPMDALPETVRLAVEEVHGFVQAPVPLVAGSALAALSLACQALIDAQRAEKLQGPVGLFLLSIADSGERKTTCDGFFSTPIRHYEEEQAEAAKPGIDRHKADLDAWTAERDGLLSAIKAASAKGKDTGQTKASLARLQGDRPEPPRVPRLMLGDETPENLAWGLARGWPSAGVLSSEAGLIFGSHGMGKDSVLRNLGLLDILWDGGSHSFGRKTSESFTVRGARLTVGLQVQEAALHDFFERTGKLARGVGFLARFLLAWPDSTQGHRPFVEPPPNWPRLAGYHARLTDILNTPAPIGNDGCLTPALLTLAPDAKRAWVFFHDAIESELADGGDLRDVRDVASKVADNAVRLAALFHLFEGGIGPIGLDAFEGASRLAAWHLSEARRFFGEIALPAELADAARLDAWLIAYCRRERTFQVGKNHARQHGPLRDGKQLDAAIRELYELDRLQVRKDDRRTTLAVNPALVEVAS